MGAGLLKVGAVSTTERAVSSAASATVWSMRNNQSLEKCSGGVLIGGPAHMGSALSEEWTRK